MWKNNVKPTRQGKIKIMSKEMKVEKLGNFIEIYRDSHGWNVDFVEDGDEFSGENLGFHATDQIKAIKYALVNLSIDKIKYHEFVGKISALNEEEMSYAHDIRYENLEAPKNERRSLFFCVKNGE